jgi:hypothetical protein
VGATGKKEKLLQGDVSVCVKNVEEIIIIIIIMVKHAT